MIPRPLRDARGVGDNADVGGSLSYRTCNGDCSCESVWFERVERDGTGFCKTAFRPYDLALTSFLVIAKHSDPNDNLHCVSDAVVEAARDSLVIGPV